MYNQQREHQLSLVLHKRHLRGKLQHRVCEFEILHTNDERLVGKICPFSTDSQRSEYAQATAVKSE